MLKTEGKGTGSMCISEGTLKHEVYFKEFHQDIRRTIFPTIASLIVISEALMG